MNETDLYERLHESEKRRKVAAVLVDSFRVAGEADIETGRAQDLTAGEAVALFQVILAALGGSFDTVREMVAASGDVMLNVRLSVLLDM